MKNIIEQLLTQAFEKLKELGIIPLEVEAKIKIERTKDSSHGDYATNVALILAKPCQQSPHRLAEQLIQHLPIHPSLQRCEIAGPGFINFFLHAGMHTETITSVLQQGESYGQCNIGQGKKLILEFVSANPTGPLHVGHGRGAAFGATLANLLKIAGFDVSREYYVNDAGRQMNILAVSVWLRYLELGGEVFPFPANGYQGDYVLKIAQIVLSQDAYRYVHPWSTICEQLPADEPQGGDKEQYIDALIKKAQMLLGEDDFALFHRHALDYVLSDIKEDLADFGVEYDCWFSEQSLEDEGAINQAVQALTRAGHTYEHEQAIWFRATDFGDEKDRVLIRANGQATYFASDVAYHWNKFARGFDQVIDIFGADHHGYVTRIKSAVRALGHDDAALNILLVQFAILYQANARVQMSTRSGSFVTLRQLRKEVGRDAARFFYVMRKPEQHMDFDLDLAKSQSNDNPVYYIQYAHARISSVLKQLRERGLSWSEAQGLTHLQLLTQPQEDHLITLIARYPDVIETAAKLCEPHQIAYYLRELANGLHSYYNAVPLLCEQEDLRSARLCLLQATRQVLRNGMRIIGVSAPESM